MILMIALFLTSFACLLVSLLALGLVFKHIYGGKEVLKTSTSHEAIIISGCDSGIGLELAKYFYKTTKYSIICCFLNIATSQGHQELSGLAIDNSRLIPIDLDIRLEEDVRSVVNKIEELKKNGQINSVAAVINNAGILTYGEFDWLTWNHIQNQIDVNLIGTLRLTRAIVPYIIESKGRIINVSSVNDTTVFPGLSIYSATKSALSTFSRGLGYELRKFGVHVVTVRLGDFARLTNIMSGHASNQNNMWNEMNSKKRELYKDFFKEFNDHLIKNYGMTSPKEFAQSSLFIDFQRALLANDPPTTITCAPLGFRIFYFVIQLLPLWIQYHLLDFLFQFGFGWKPPQVRN